MNKTNILQFLECYERHPCLWNPRELDYRNNNLRVAALQSIIKEMRLNITIDELKTKIKNVRTTYSREVNKIVESKKYGASEEDVYKPQLMWFSVADRFLKPLIEGRSSKDNTIKANENSSLTMNSDSSSFFGELGQAPPSVPVQKKKKFSSPKNRAQQTVPPVLQAIHKLEALVQKIRQDEFDTFGQHVANQLRGLPLTNAIRCQNFISNYLAQERLGVLKSRRPPASGAASSASE